MQLVKTSCNLTSPEHDIYVQGEIDLAAEAELIDAIEQFQSCEHADVCIDASALDFIDSTGLTLLAQLTRVARGRGGSVRVTGAPRQLERMVEITNLPVEVVEDPTAGCGDDAPARP